MRSGQLVLVACKLRRGAFSGERVFQLTMAGERGRYVGISPVDHCLDSNQEHLDRDHPPVGVEIDGYVEAFLIANGGAEARVELPDGVPIHVAVSQVPFQKESERGSRYVPV